jgi:hypothetical protein
MPHRLMLMLALALMRVALCLPVAGLVLFGWASCGEAAWSAPSMVAVQGQLLYIGTDGHSASGAKPRGKKVEYTYVFGQREYQGHSATFCSAHTTVSQIEPLAEMYAQLVPLVGKAVTVWVDPARPDNAVLFKYVPRAAMLMLGVGLLFLLIYTAKLEQYLSRHLRQRFGA